MLMTTGTRTGSTDHMSCADAPDKLLNSQLKAVRLILDGVGKGHERAKAVTDKPQYNDRPNQVYLIDGGRGAGKTYTLLTAEKAIRSIIQGTRSDPTEVKAWEHETKVVNNGSPIRAKILRLIFPGEFSEGEMLMEHIFAAMKDMLNDAEKLAAKDDREDDRKRARDLQLKLIEDVAQGWYFAKRFGLEAVIRDAINYDDLVSNWSKESGKAYQRIDKWRDFVTEWLVYMKADLLVIMLDDSDNDEVLTDSILHSLRMVLDHPQIVTILAGNMTAIRESLLHVRMSRMARSIQALGNGQEPSAKEWRRRLRRELEEYLEKIIPQQQRSYLSVGRLGGSPENERGDFEQIVDIALARMVESALHDTRGDFLTAKFDMALRHEAQKSDATKPTQQRRLEAFLSWWLFGNLYAAELKPRSVRNLKTLHDYYSDDIQKAKRDEPGLWRKRLPVVLYGMSANFNLLQWLTDDDPALIPWLRQQHLRSDWSQRRAFIVNSRVLPRRDYGNAFLRYQLDLGLAMPFRDNADKMVPPELLPVPIGRRHLRRFFQPRQSPRRHRRLGLARWLDHAAIPSNCFYFHDLMALPDGAFIDVEQIPERRRRDEIDELQTGRWESQLADRWLSTVEDDQETDADEYLARYFREIVCETLRGSQCYTAGEMLNLMDPPDVAEKQTRAIYEYFVADELRLFDTAFRDRAGIFREIVSARMGGGNAMVQRTPAPAAPPAQAELGDDRSPNARSALPPDSATGNVRLDDEHRMTNPERMIALYASLATDLRRGWHAVRIHKVAPPLLSQALGGAGEQEIHAIVANKDRLRLYRCQSIRDELLADEWTAGALAQLEKNTLVDRFDNYFKQHSPKADKIRENLEIFKRFLEIRLDRIKESKGGKARVAAIEELVTVLIHSHVCDLIVPPEMGAPQNKDKTADVRLSATVRPSILLKNLRDIRKNVVRFCEQASGSEASPELKRLAVAQGRFRLYLREIDIERLYEAGEALAEKVQVQEEGESFDAWTWTLRNLARSLCRGWPFHDSVISPAPAYEYFLQAGEDLLPIQSRVTGGKVSEQDSTAPELPQKARSARNYALFLYGLAPSLPAMLHASVMSRVYEAKMRIAAIRQGAYDKRPDTADGAASNSSDPGANRLDKRYETIVAGALTLLGEALDEADEWAYLIGQMSVLLRVVKTKTLHLDLRLLINASQSKDMPTSEGAGEEESAGENGKVAQAEAEQAVNFLQAVRRNPRAAMELDKSRSDGAPVAPSGSTAAEVARNRRRQDREDGERLIKICSKLLKTRKESPDDYYKLITGLAIFPDIAPSSLFGEEWLGDLISRRAFLDWLEPEGTGRNGSESGDNASADLVDELWSTDRSNPARVITASSLSVTGTFGETEQWLWAANRTLRKLREQIVKDAGAWVPDGAIDELKKLKQPAHLPDKADRFDRAATLRTFAPDALAMLNMTAPSTKAAG